MYDLLYLNTKSVRTYREVYVKNSLENLNKIDFTYSHLANCHRWF